MKIETIVVGRLYVNCYVVYDEQTKNAVLIDPGDNPEKISAYLSENGLTPKAIMLTHSHFDHVLAVEALREQYNIPVAIHENEKRLLENEEKIAAAPYHKVPVCITANVYLQDNEEYAPLEGSPAFLVLHTPGHTEGGASYYMKELNAVFTGDTLFNMSIGRSDFPTGDHETLISSINRKLMTLDETVAVYPGHGSASTIGDEKKRNPFLN